MARVSYGAALGWLAAEAPGRPAAICGAESISRMELERRSNRLARAYQQLGVGPESRVTLALPNSLEFLAACMAVWKLGASPQPISARLPAKEREAIVALSQPALIVGVGAAEYPKFASVPAGFAPSAALSDSPLPDVVPQHVRTMTSGGGRPKLIIDLTPHSAIEVAGLHAAARSRSGAALSRRSFIVAWRCILSGDAGADGAFDAEQALARSRSTASTGCCSCRP
jgi:bile acid-coenzyme A ligase